MSSVMESAVHVPTDHPHHLTFEAAGASAVHPAGARRGALG